MSTVELLILGIAGGVMLAVWRGIRTRKAESARERAVVTATSPNQFGSRESDHEYRTEESATSDAFRFSPELFEQRTRVIEALDADGFAWFSHYSAVDCLHDVHGIEVCGIQERDDAVSILRILMRMFPDWKPG